MKNIANIISRGNLTPRERYLLLIHNDVHRIKTGKEILSEADKEALEQWHAKTNEEAREWNRLNEGWKYTGRMELENEFCFNEAQIAYFQVKPILMELLKLPALREMQTMLLGLKSIKKVGAAEAISIIQKQRDAKLRDGLDFEYAVYQLAFERLSDDDRKRLVELYPDIEFDHQYLDQEEIIAHLLGDKEALTEKAKEKLAQMIAEQSYNSFAKEYQLYHYFACIPLAEVARYFLKSKGVEVSGKALEQNQEADDEDSDTHDQIQEAVEAYAKEHKTTVEAILKEGFIDWYDVEGFVYTPLVVSDDKDLFERWLAAKAAVRKELQRLIKAGKLQTRKRLPEETWIEKLYSKGLYDSELAGARKALELLELSAPGGELEEKKAFETFSDTIIAGESLYALQDDFAFVKEFKKRIDEYDANLGLVYAEDDPTHTGEHLDQELLVCALGSKGEIAWFSRYAMSLKRLEVLLGSLTFFEIKKKDGKMFLAFKNKGVEKMFKDSRREFVVAYGKLMALRDVLQKLDPVYETDVAYRVKDLLNRLDGYIQSHNEALAIAQHPLEYLPNKKKSKTRSFAATLNVDETLFIDKKEIKPDSAVAEEHAKKLREILGTSLE